MKLATAVYSWSAHWGRSGRMAEAQEKAKEILAGPAAEERAFVHGSIGRLREAAGMMAAVALGEEREELVVGTEQRWW